MLAIAFQYGVNLCKEIGKSPLYIGTWYYRNPWVADRIDDKIINLRAGDLILFPDRKRPVVHSAVIQSIDLQQGQIIYVQCTDWVFDRKQRGPHVSEINFDPYFSEMRLSGTSLVWMQKVGPDFDLRSS